MAKLGWSDLSPLGQAGIITQGFGAVSGAVGSFYAASAEKYKTKSLALSLQHKKDMALFNMRQKESQAQHIMRSFNKQYQIMTLKQGRAKSKNIVSIASREGVGLAIQGDMYGVSASNMFATASSISPFMNMSSSLLTGTGNVLSSLPEGMLRA